MRQISTANVVLNFHSGDQYSAAALMNNLMYVEDQIPCRYFLQYGDAWDSLKIRDTIDRLAAVKNIVINNDLPLINLPEQFVEDDPNDFPFSGAHTRRELGFKRKFFQWNLSVFKYIQELDHFQIIEPDCVILKDGWIRDIVAGFCHSKLPIYGHLKKGRIGEKEWATHWAGCSYYDGSRLRELPLMEGFSERYENPWWPYRNRQGTSTANNAFFGPVFSGYDATYDYFLFALYWRERTGSNDPEVWQSELEDADSEIFCDFRSNLDKEEILSRYWDKIALFHGAKNDGVRVETARRFLLRRCFKAREAARNNNVKPPIEMSQLRNAFDNERCIIIGNGPSLKKIDVELLKENWTIGTNRIYLLTEKTGFEPSFYCCVNPHVIDQFGQDIAQVRSIKWVRDHRRDLVVDDGKTFYMQSEPRISFVDDLSMLRWHEGWTVTFCAMQVAFFLGFSEVILVGVDHHFERSGEPNRLVKETESDSNHFDARYFGRGVEWQFPDLARSENSYRLAKRAFEKDGRRIYDATVDGHLTVFPKADCREVLARPPRARKVGRFDGPVGFVGRFVDRMRERK